MVLDGVLRVGGGLAAAAMPEHMKHPIIIPKDVRMTTLQDTHEKIGHCGRLYMLSELQQKYRIPSANSALRNFLSGCIICWNAKGKPLEQTGQEDRPPPDELPVTDVGVDRVGLLI